MNNIIGAIVVDSNGYVADIGLVSVIDDEVQYYAMQDGEGLVFDDLEEAIALQEKWTMVRWDGEKWTGEGDEIPPPPDLPPPPPMPGQQFTQEQAKWLQGFMIGYTEPEEEDDNGNE